MKNSIDIDKDTILINACYEVYNIKGEYKLTLFNYDFDKSADITVNLLDEKSEVEFHYSTVNIHENTLNLTINHLANNTVSNVYNHGINLGDSKLDFNINSVVFKDIKGTVVNQENTILSERKGLCRINPNLIINNYDVSSSHSAYIGSFNKDEMFYLASRGIGKDIAKKLLISASLLNGGDKEFIEYKGLIEKLDEVYYG